MAATPLRLGVFGNGLIAAAHAGALRHVPEAELVAVCGPHRERVDAFAARFGLSFATTDVEALLARPDVDAILVDAPDEFHRDLTLQALAAGKHVLCEKPLASTVEDCRTMLEAARQASVKSMVGFSNRRFPWAQAARRLIDDGSLGRVFHAQVQSLSASMLRPGARQRWRSDPVRAPLGVLGDLGSHAIDLLRSFFGEVAEVSADVRSLSYPDVANDDCVVLLRMANGVHASLAFSRVSLADRHYGPGRRSFLLSGEGGTFAFENGRARFIPIQGDERDVTATPTAAEHEDYLVGATEPTVRAFVEAVRSGSEPTPTFFDGLRCAQVLEAAMQSSEQRRWVTVPGAEG